MPNECQIGKRLLAVQFEGREGSFEEQQASLRLPPVLALDY